MASGMGHEVIKHPPRATPIGVLAIHDNLTISLVTGTSPLAAGGPRPHGGIWQRDK
jgi:hypothetical protein